MKEGIILVGGGGHCRSAIDVIEAAEKFKIFGIIDLKEKVGETIFGYKITGTDEDLKEIYNECKMVNITIGHIKSAELRIKMYDLLKHIGYVFPVIISPLAYVSKYATIGEGTIIMHHAVVNAGAKIGKNCIINSKALIEHDAVIGDYCHISTAAVINGGVVVKDASFIGSNAVTKQYITIEENSFIKAGSVII